MRNFIISGLLFFAFSTLSAQEVEKQRFFKKYPFVNQTDFGYLFGRIKMPTYYGGWGGYYGSGNSQDYQIKATRDLSINTFNGVFLNKKTAVGISVGVDDYEGSLITPLQIGVRQTLLQKNELGNEIFGALDGGWGSTILHADDSNFSTKGGFTANPAIGYKIRMRNSSSFIFSFGYKYQYLTVQYDNWENEFSYYLETRQHHRLSARVGIQF